MAKDIKKIKRKEDLSENDIDKLVLIGSNSRRSVIIEVTEHGFRSVESIPHKTDLGIWGYGYVKRSGGDYAPILRDFEREIKTESDEYTKYSSILEQGTD